MKAFSGRRIGWKQLLFLFSFLIVCIATPQLTVSAQCGSSGGGGGGGGGAIIGGGDSGIPGLGNPLDPRGGAGNALGATANAIDITSSGWDGAVKGLAGRGGSGGAAIAGGTIGIAGAAAGMAAGTIAGWGGKMFGQGVGKLVTGQKLTYGDVLLTAAGGGFIIAGGLAVAAMGGGAFVAAGFLLGVGTGIVQGIGAAMSKGDPHIYTFDGGAYDFMGVGEYTLVESRAGEEFFIQVRQQTPDRSSCPGVSINTAMATKIGNNTITIDQEFEGPKFRVNGKPVPTDQLPLNFNGEGSIVPLPHRSYEITWKGGETLYVNGIMGSIGMSLILPESRRGQVQGLLGTLNGSSADDIRLRSGEVLKEPLTFTDLYERFNESWRISPSESIFSYPEGKSTEDYVNRDFPNVRLNTNHIPPEKMEKAIQVCKQKGVSGTITSSVNMRNCVIDVACMGEPQYSEYYENMKEPDRTIHLAREISFEKWSAEGPRPGTWDTKNNNRSCEQSDENAFGFFVSPDSVINRIISGTITVDNKDGDYVGLVFGYRSPLKENGDESTHYQTLLLSWKGNRQKRAREGWTLSYLNGKIPHPGPAFWKQAESDNCTIIARNQGPATGWEPGTTYNFRLRYTGSGIRFELGPATVFDLEANEIPDGALQGGRLGLYSYSQSGVVFENLEISPIQPE